MNVLIDTNMILALIPIFIFQLLLAGYCIFKIVKDGTANLNKLAWIVIVLFFNLIGPIMFLIVGRRKDI